MAFGQSLIVAFVASEAAGYIAEKRNVSPKDVRLTKCIVATGTGFIAAIATADPVGAVGTTVLGAAYLGGYDPLYLVGQSFESFFESKSKMYSGDS